MSQIDFKKLGISARANSLILIGMPGAGKSTIGLLLAKTLAKNFVDTDLLIQNSEGKTLDYILHAEGYEKLRELEEQHLLANHFTNHIVATGGSAVYSEAAMIHLHKFGPCIYLAVDQDELEKRIHNMSTRGIASPPQQSFGDIYAERTKLYEKYASVTIDCTLKHQEQIVDEIIYWNSEGLAELDA